MSKVNKRVEIIDLEKDNDFENNSTQMDHLKISVISANSIANQVKKTSTLVNAMKSLIGASKEARIGHTMRLPTNFDEMSQCLLDDLDLEHRTFQQQLDSHRTATTIKIKAFIAKLKGDFADDVKVEVSTLIISIFVLKCFYFLI